MGHFSALDNKPMELPEELESAFRIFAARGAAELKRLRAEGAIRDSEQRYSRLFESAMDGIFELDEELKIERANGSARMLFGLGSGELANRKVTDLLSPVSAQKLGNLIRELSSTQQPFAWVPGGVIVVVSATPVETLERCGIKEQ